MKQDTKQLSCTIMNTYQFYLLGALTDEKLTLVKRTSEKGYYEVIARAILNRAMKRAGFINGLNSKDIAKFVIEWTIEDNESFGENYEPFYYADSIANTLIFSNLHIIAFENKTEIPTFEKDKIYSYVLSLLGDSLKAISQDVQE